MSRDDIKAKAQEDPGHKRVRSVLEADSDWKSDFGAPAVPKTLPYGFLQARLDKDFRQINYLTDRVAHSIILDCFFEMTNSDYLRTMGAAGRQKLITVVA